MEFIFYFFIFSSFLLIFSIFNCIYRKIKLKNQNYLNKDTVVIITGGCMGIGLEIIKILINTYKCKVINIDIRDDLFNEDSRVYNYKCDLSNKSEITEIVEKIKNKFEKIDILINNAGIAFNRNFENLDENNFIKTLEVNLIAPVILVKEFLHKNTNSPFHIVNMGSVMSHLTSAKSTDYISSKWGLFSFHECLRYDYYNNPNLFFTIICPFAVSTGMFPGFESPLSFINVLEPLYVASQTVDSIILKEKIVFIPYYMEYICLVFKILPTGLRDFIYFKFMHKATEKLTSRCKILKID